MSSDAIASPAAETEARWERLRGNFALALAAGASRVREAGGAPHSVQLDERLVQAIWHDQMLRAEELVTASGKRLEVIEPGRWNTTRGPDFLDARIRLAGEVVQGDIEIHVHSADWSRHGHHQDFEYNRTILHVALRPGDDRPYDEKQNGERLERLYIEHALEPDLDTIRATINAADYPHGRPAHLGLCHEEFLRLPDPQLQEFLLAAGKSRMEQKIARFAAQRATADFPQLVYQSVMTGQGFKGSKTLYFLLSKRAPLSELVEMSRDFPEAERADFFLSVLLHVAGIVGRSGSFLEEPDEETRAFQDRLTRLWRAAAPYFSDRLMPPTKRWFSGMRPAGFPTRRLAAVALLLARLADPHAPLFSYLLEQIRNAPLNAMSAKELREFHRRLLGQIVVPGDAHYFGMHFTLGGKKQKPQSLLGEPAAESLVFNVVLPLGILSARETRDRALAENCWRLALGFPSLEKNSIVSFMEKRIFGETGAARSLTRLEIFQQALLKIFSDCCAQNERTCDDCTFFSLAERLRREGVAT